MIFQTAMDGAAGEIALRSVRNSTTGTSTVTIAAGTPLVLETNTASTGGGYVMQALTSTSVVNNLYVGNANAAIAPDSVGLAQCYGVDTDAVVATAGASVGAVLVPNIATLVTAAAFGTAGGSMGINTAASIVVLVAPSGAAQAATPVWVHAL